MPPRSFGYGARPRPSCDVYLLDLTIQARQLSLIEFGLFGKLQPRELLRCAWTKKDKQRRAPNVLALSAHFNTVANWVRRRLCPSPQPHAAPSSPSPSVRW